MSVECKEINSLCIYRINMNLIGYIFSTNTNNNVNSMRVLEKVVVFNKKQMESNDNHLHFHKKRVAKYL